MADSLSSQAKDNSEAVRALVIPLEGLNLVLPSIAVAEVVPYSPPEPRPDAAPWILGMLRWRGLQVPLVSVEAFSYSVAEPAEAPKRVIILNTLNGNKRLPFIAIGAQGLPRSIQLTEEAVGPSRPAGERGFAQHFSVGTIQLTVPDLDVLEGALVQGGVAASPDGM